MATEQIVQEVARESAIASAGGKTALTAGGVLAGIGWLSSDVVFAIIGSCIAAIGLGVNWWYSRLRRNDEKAERAHRMQIERERNAREHAEHELRRQLLERQLNDRVEGGR